MAQDPSQVDTILSQLQTAGASYKANTPGAREKLMSLSYDLISKLELPSESIMRMGWAEPAKAANCRTAIDLKIFDHLKESGEAGITAKELALKTSADENLILRIMRHLAAMNVINEKSENTYSNTTLSDALSEPRYRDGILFLYDVARPSFQHLPEYLRNTNYALPTSVTDGPFQAAHKTDLTAFAWLDKTPPYLQAFNNYMSAYRSGKPSWVDPGFYPVSERLVEGFNPEYSDVLLVDVGGGKGHDLHELREKHPQLPGKLILQDREAVISSLSEKDGGVFEALSHDFFTAQPVKHARAYHLHSILHNWSDDDCVKILRQLRPAMKPGYSRLLINEIVVPPQKAGWPITSMDHVMLILAAIQERTEAHLVELLKKAGFRLVKIYTYESGQESLVEAEVDESQS
ncbi:putative O-methyltransferase [Daldinia caldariorum]|uniref:putative O-methyltransferase n=1 Tax=Daldinia caldariorum TaxID=326644 RepID=UPI0020089F6D|nr:putative O-methyltransferase [Daldinia caldariorum]KAI1466310.1 putative O-methyltransferase [Daldinia caldariorum]